MVSGGTGNCPIQVPHQFIKGLAEKTQGRASQVFRGTSCFRVQDSVGNGFLYTKKGPDRSPIFRIFQDIPVTVYIILDLNAIPVLCFSRANLF